LIDRLIDSDTEQLLLFVVVYRVPAPDPRGSRTGSQLSI